LLRSGDFRDAALHLIGSYPDLIYSAQSKGDGLRHHGPPNL